MLTSTLRRNVSNRSLKDLQKSLLYTLSGNVSRYGAVFAFSGNFIDLVYIDYSSLGKLNVIIRRLNKSKKNIFHVLTNVTCLCESGCIGDSEGNLKRFCKCLRKVCLSYACRAYKKHVALVKLNIIGWLSVFALIFLFLLLIKYALVMIIYGNREGDLSIVLTDNVFIKRLFDLFRLGEGIDRHSVKLCRGICIFINKLFAGIYTEIAYINS